ncbi:MAG: type IV pilus twitching motility protein PilT [Planctomycetes bacterium]|nr:type IV pilus twitching motility protein PilT [Planctomycetota bacterium]
MAKLDAFFSKMVDIQGSDLHLTTGLPPYFRLHGDMVAVNGVQAFEAEEMQQMLFEITPEHNQQQFEREHDTDFAYELPGKARFRCNLFMDHRGPGAVFRQIPSQVSTFEQLGLPKAVKDMCHLSKGLVLVTGPTGSGKSTTLAAMIDHINKTRSDHIITIEDPIEFVHQTQKCLVHQREVGRHTESFKRALRAALREDPDIVMVGEMRDLETIAIAIETAETGHLVFGTLHTTTAMSTVDRIVDQFPADRQDQIKTMLASSLKGVVAQTLLKKKPKGRVAALEILIGTKAVAALIREGKTHQLMSQMQMGGKIGMRLLNDSLLELVQKGLVDPAEAYLKAVEKETLLQQFNHAGIKLDPAQLGELGESAGPAHEAPSMGSAPSHQPNPSGPMPSRSGPSSSPISSAPLGGPAPTPPLPKKTAPIDPALEEFRKKRGY